jgi:hypothetical protein
LARPLAKQPLTFKQIKAVIAGVKRRNKQQPKETYPPEHFEELELLQQFQPTPLTNQSGTKLSSKHQ